VEDDNDYNYEILCLDKPAMSSNFLSAVIRNKVIVGIDWINESIKKHRFLGNAK
jgi:hypothetical protein